MKKKLLTLLSLGVVAASVTACGATGDSGSAEQTAVTEADANDDAEPATAIANPWRDCTEEEAYQNAPNGFSAPEDAENVRWSICEAEDGFVLPGTMVQLDFDYDDLHFTAREQSVSGEEITDISGLYYEWTVTDDSDLNYWGGGQMPCRLCRYIGEDQYIDLCLWFDIETGYAYSLSTEAPDLSGFDIRAIAEAIYDPAKQIGANAPSTEALEEISTEAIADAAEQIAPVLDPTGCDTFTQMIDKLFTDGMGYANIKVGDTDVFFASSGTFKDPDAGDAAIDAALFIYKDDKPFEIGKVASGGTAYPLTIRDGFLYTGSNHWICKYTVTDDTLMLVEKAAVAYGATGYETYYYEAEDGDHTDLTSEESEELFNKLLDEMLSGEVIAFSTVGG